jgi:subtilisin family serine protease
MAAPVILPRYGLAPDVELFVGKVLNNNGGGQDGAVLMGMNWAIENKCRIVSMSLGTIVSADKPYNPVFEASAQRALQSGTLIVAAAGNNSDRASGVISPVTHPANCPSIMAVSALDSSLKVANFANGGLNSKGGQIDVIGPGVKIYSSWLMPTRYRAISGTSMATPHVAAVAALIAEANPTMSGQSLWARIVQTAKRLPLPASDVGAGLVQAP